MRNTFRYSFATVLTAGMVVAPMTAAFANPTTGGSGGIGSGNQVVVPADVEANLCGNSIAALGISEAECTQVSEALYASSGQGASTDGSGGVASGNQIIIPVDAAIEVCGNSVSVLGGSTAKCTTVVNVIHASPENEGGASTDGSGGVASGNQVIVPVDAAVEICGNAVSVLGVAEASCMTQISADGDSGDGDGGDNGGDGGDGDGNGGGDNGGGDGDGNGGGDNGGGDGDGSGEGSGDGGSEDDGDESAAGDDESSSAPQADRQLAVTGSALGGLVAAAVAAIGAGGAGLYFARKRKAALATADEE